MAGALAQQVWTRPGIARLALGEGAVAIVDGALELPRTDDRDRDRGRRGGEVAGRRSSACGARSAEHELERADVVVCVGGGSITDVGGFAAATFRRGLPWLAVPSTLVGQVDAAIGGKTAINVAAKNDVGAFWQPAAVLCDPELLETLPPREWAGGMARGRQDGAARRRAAVGARRGLGARPGRRRAGARELVQRCAGVKTLVVARRSRGARAARDPQPRPHDRPRHRVRGGLRRPLARRVRRDRPGRRAAPLRAARGPRRRGRPSASRSCSRATRCPCARPGSTPTPCSRRCATTRSARPGRTGWCCSRRSGGPSTASRSATTCSPTLYALPRAAD